MRIMPKKISRIFGFTLIFCNRESVSVSHNPESLYLFCFTTRNATRYQIPPIQLPIQINVNVFSIFLLKRKSMQIINIKSDNQIIFK